MDSVATSPSGLGVLSGELGFGRVLSVGTGTEGFRLRLHLIIENGVGAWMSLLVVGLRGDFGIGRSELGGEPLRRVEAQAQ